MAFTPQPVDTSSPTPIPLSSAVPDGTNTPTAIEGGPIINTGGNNLTPVSMYVKDGNDVTLGTSTDANTFASVMGRLTKIRDLLAATITVSVSNAVALGQAIMANSSPVTIASDQVHAANSDGLSYASTLEHAIALYGNGPIDSTGKPQSLNLDRARSWQGKNLFSAAITSTTAGDTNLTFSAAPKSVMPGQAIMLSGAATSEVVYVTLSYTISSSATVIPLQAPVVSSGQTTAKYDQFHAYGGNIGFMTHMGVQPTIMLMQDTTPLNGLAALTNAHVDAGSQTQYLETQTGLFNGATIDRARSNLDVTLLASAARTTTQTSADIINYNGRGLKVTLDMTVVGTGSVTLTINYKDPASGKYILLLSGVAVVTNITSVYTIYPGMVAAANVSANDILPRTFQIITTANNANSATYSVGYSIMAN